MIPDDVGGNLAPAHRPANEGAGKVFGVIQHELVAGLGGNGFEGDEGVGPAVVTVIRECVRLPVVGSEQLASALELFAAKGKGDMDFVNNAAGHWHEPVVKRAVRIVIGAASGDELDGVARRRV